MATSSWKTDHQLEADSSSLFFSRCNLSVPRFEFFLVLFLISLPFQFCLWEMFIWLSAKLSPADRFFPYCYVRHIQVFTTDGISLVALFALLFSKKVPWKRCFIDGHAKFLSALLFISWLSIQFSGVVPFPLQYFRLGQESIPILFCMLIPYGFTAESFPRFLRWAFTAFFIVAVIEAVLAIAQYFLQDSIGLYLLGEQHNFSRFDVYGGYRWIFDALFDLKREGGFVNRASGTTLHPNTLGSILFLALMTGYALYAKATTKKTRGAFLAGIFVIFTALFLAFSRASMIATVIGTVLWLVAMRKNLFGEQLSLSSSLGQLIQKIKKVVLNPLVFVLLGALATCFALFYPVFIARGVVNENTVVQYAREERMSNYQVALAMISANPILGVGYNSYQIAKLDYAPPEKANEAPVHNVYLHIAAERGCLGLLAYLLFIGTVLYRAFKTRFDPLHASLLIAFTGFLIMALADYGFLLMNNLRFLFYLVAAFLAAPSLLARKEEQAS